jgi:hypothetical protein
MKLKELLQKTNGKFFTVIFTKKNGDDRQMNCRLGVTKHLKGGVNKNSNKNHLVVYDVHSKGYRTVNTETLKSIKLGGKVYKVDNNKLWELVA